MAWVVCLGCVGIISTELHATQALGSSFQLITKRTHWAYLLTVLACSWRGLPIPSNPLPSREASKNGSWTTILEAVAKEACLLVDDSPRTANCCTSSNKAHSRDSRNQCRHAHAAQQMVMPPMAIALQ